MLLPLVNTGGSSECGHGHLGVRSGYDSECFIPLAIKSRGNERQSRGRRWMAGRDATRPLVVGKQISAQTTDEVEALDMKVSSIGSAPYVAVDDYDGA